ncbi:TetR/AcrR family transcriptional regulator [Govanella unica]|uniref:TetR/AcrR family transcriptional regulator n=1 Tax=Govanella unica TaxID=2975056 RepID=A0A9X3Z826_9PROT|nr:TetR/AcrR family transcriptional regulator [Govania unica]MDA5194807.1 TetR/AcrR family transcriptional regulator [Govania unica]
MPKPTGNKAGKRAGLVTRIVNPARKLTVKTPLPPTRKGSRTREKLKEAALRALEHKGYRSLRLTDIALEADVNISLVYHYFNDKADLVFEALRDMVSIRRHFEADPTRPHEPFAALYYANKRFADFYQAHPGLIRSLLHFDEDNPKFHDLYSEVNQDWMTHIADNIRKRAVAVNLSEPEAFAIAYALGGLVEKFLFDLYVERNPALMSEFTSTSDAARFLAILWFRALYLANPTEAELAKFTKFDKLHVTDIA